MSLHLRSSDTTSELSQLGVALMNASRRRDPVQYRFRQGMTACETIALITVARGTSKEAAESDLAIEEIRLAHTDGADAPLLLLSHHPRRTLEASMPAALSDPGVSFRRLPMRLAVLHGTITQLSRMSPEELAATRLSIWRRRLRRRVRALRHRTASVSAVLLAAARSVEQRGYEERGNAPIPEALAGLRRDWKKLNESLSEFCSEVERLFDEFRPYVSEVPTRSAVAEAVSDVRAAAGAFAIGGRDVSCTNMARDTRIAFDVITRILTEPNAKGEL